MNVIRNNFVANVTLRSPVGNEIIGVIIGIFIFIYNYLLVLL
jgi:hypothetical protein